MKALCVLPLALIFALSIASAETPEHLSAPTRSEFNTIAANHQTALATVNQPLTKLAENYKAALNKQRDAAKAAGKLDRVVAIEEALQSLDEDKTGQASSSDPEIAKLAKVFATEREKISGTLKAGQAKAWQKYSSDLATFVAKLTKEDKIDDAKIVREQLSEAERTIDNLTGKSSDATAWDGEWNVDYSNNYTRRIQITMRDPGVLDIQAKEGTYEPYASYKATWDPQRKCFIAPQTARSGKPRGESYELDGKTIKIRHWIDDGTFEKPTVTATAKRKKSD